MSLDIAERIAELFTSNLPDAPDGLTLLRKNKLDRLPMPGQGSTLERWRTLAAVGRFDLSLTKLFEGHTDALAIIQEIEPHAGPIPDGAWCVWAAEAPGGRCTIHRGEDGAVVLSGSKRWCSGATTGDYALLTAWEADAVLPQLVAVRLDQPGLVMDASHWKAVGMVSSMSVTVTFAGAKGRCVGQPGQYLSRPGFWHGGAGIAACWHGGAVGLASALKTSLLASTRNNSNAHRNDGLSFKLASLGKIELAIEDSAATLRQAAAWIDEHPMLDASRIALTARLSAEHCAQRVIDEAGKALGATSFCLDAKFARAVADLPVFIRQSHGDRDFAALGERSLARGSTAWTL